MIDSRNDNERFYFLAFIRKIKTRIFIFTNKGANLNPSDNVIVQIDGKYEVGTICKKILDFEKNKDLKLKKVYKIVRKCNENDFEIIKNNSDMSKDIMEKCKNIILRQKMKDDMKITDVELIFSKDKCIIYYTSDDRVDFRELLKNLNKILLVKIQMIQIGVRDEVKIKGSLGQCGNVVCCKRFLNKMNPIAIDMVKEQNLYIGSNKISGVCQRLMCCLEFESEVYKDLISRMPSSGCICETSFGKGKIESRNLLKEEVDVSFEDGSIKTFALKDIKLSKK